MPNRNTGIGKLSGLLIAFVALAAFQPGVAETQDIEEIRKAAEGGHADAQYRLGLVYALGSSGHDQDYRETVKWYRKASEQGGDTVEAGMASQILSVMYLEGREVPQDLVKAYAWIIVAVAQGNNNAIQSRKIVRIKITAEQVAEAQKLAAKLFKRIESSKSQ